MYKKTDGTTHHHDQKEIATRNPNENNKNLSLCCQCNSGIKSFFEREKGAGSVAHEAAETEQKEQLH